MTKLKSPASKAAADSELIATIEEQSAELRLLRKEVAEWKKKYEKGELRDIAFTNSEKEVSRSTRRSMRRRRTPRRWECQGFTRIRAEFIRLVIAGACGRCANSPDSEAPATLTSGTSSSSRTARLDSRSRSISQR